MSEPKKWVGYADLLEAKRKREERAGLQEQSPVFKEQFPASKSLPPTTDLIQPETNTVLTPVDTPVNTEPVTPVDTSVAISALPITDEASEVSYQPSYLDATHTGSEQRVYSVMYRDTVSKGVRERHFGPTELARKTGIRSDRTIRTAIQGLIKKLSVEVVSNVNGNPLGPRYKIFDPKEIIKRRRAAGMKIDPQSKKITSKNLSTLVTTGVTTRDKNYRGAPVESTGVTGVVSTGVIKYINEDYQTEAATASSSSKSSAPDADDDDGVLNSLREVYERVTGNTWTTADVVTAQRGRDIPPEVWAIAICYCMDRAPGHKFDRLAYVLEEARHHQEEMGGFAKEDLRLIMKHSLRQIERARTSGMWEPAAREQGSEG